MKRKLKLPVLMYHHVGPLRPGTPRTLSVRTESFREQMDWVANHGYRTITAGDWLRACRRGTKLPPKPILITFDDGYADICDYALPHLTELGFKATVFIVTSLIGREMTWDLPKTPGRHRLMSSAQIHEWALRGVEFGSHSRTHPYFDSLPSHNLREELRSSREALADLLGMRPEAIAYPYGHWNETVARAAGEFYGIGVTTDEGLNRSDTPLLSLCRTMVQRSDGLHEFSGRVRWGHSPLEHARKRWWSWKNRVGDTIARRGGQAAYENSRRIFKVLTGAARTDDAEAVHYDEHCDSVEK